MDNDESQLAIVAGWLSFFEIKTSFVSDKREEASGERKTSADGSLLYISKL
jgi:hypothetical protein